MSEADSEKKWCVEFWKPYVSDPKKEDAKSGFVVERLNRAGDDLRKALGCTGKSSFWEGLFANSINGVSEARKIFIDDIRQLSTLIAIMIVGAGIVASYATSSEIWSESFALFLVAGLLLVFIVPFLYVASVKSRRAYEFYVSASIHATVVQLAIKAGFIHRWSAFVLRNADDLDSAISEQNDGSHLLKIRRVGLVPQIFRRSRQQGILELNLYWTDIFRYWPQTSLFFGEEIQEKIDEKNWSHFLTERWMSSSDDQSLLGKNLLQSFRVMLFSAFLVCLLAFVANAALGYLHLKNLTDNSTAKISQVKELNNEILLLREALSTISRRLTNQPENGPVGSSSNEAITSGDKASLNANSSGKSNSIENSGSDGQETSGLDVPKTNDPNENTTIPNSSNAQPSKNSLDTDKE